MKCYVKAEETYLEKEAKAYCLVQQARAPNLKPREMEELYLQAALAFLECDKSKHDVKSLRYAASFLKKAKRPNEAGLLYAKLSRHKDAIREFKKSKNFKGLVLLKEQEGNYNDAVSLLVDNGKKDDALECAERYEGEGHILRNDLQASILAMRYAKDICDHTLTPKSYNRLVKLVRYMDNPIDRVNYLKIAKKYRDALNILCNNKKFDEAYRLCAAQGWADDGLKLAEEKKDANWAQQFIFQKAIISLVREDMVESSIIKRLHSLKDSNDEQVNAKANLLLGKSNHDFFLCRTAFKIYLSTLNPAGCIEAFNLMIQFRTKAGIGSKSTEINVRQILDTCSKATDISQTLECVLNHQPLSAVQEHILRQLEEFYGLQRHFSVADKNVVSYFLMPNQHIWVDLCSGHDNVVDTDGMIQMERTKALRMISSHVQEFLLRWQEKDELQVCQLFRSRLSSFRFQKKLENKGCVRKSYKMSYEARHLYQFLKLCYSGLELSKFANGEIKQAYVIQLLVNFFRPAPSLYLGVTRGQMEDIIKSSSATLVLAQYSQEIIEKSEYDFHVDNWLDAWTIFSILGKDHLDGLLRQLNKCAAHAKTLPLNKMPDVYIRSRDAVGYEHVFSLWIRACSFIQNDKKVITSSKVVLHYFLETIIRSRSIRLTISVTSLINILTIHTTALLMLTALCNFIQRKPSNILIPNSYERVLNVYHNVGKLANRDSIRVLDACMGDEKVVKAYEKMRSNQHAVQNVQKEITRLLWQILDLLLGRHAHYFHPLRYAMKSEDCTKKGETRHCLLLVLVLFGNLGEIDVQCTPNGLQSYHNVINDAVEFLKDSIGEEAQILRKAYGMFSTSANTTGFFLAISHLIASVDSHDYITRINIRQLPNNWRWNLEGAHVSHYPARPLLPTAKKSTQLQTPPQMQSGGPSGPIERSALLQQAVDSAFESPVPSHPASAYPTNVTVTSNPQEVSMPNLQENVGIETTLNDREPTTAPTGKDDVQALTSLQLSVEPQEEEQSRVTFEEIEDEDLKNVMLSGPFVLDKQLSSETTAEQDNSALMEDTSMIDEQFCQFCAVPLRAAETIVPIAELEEGTTDEKLADDEPTSEDKGEEIKIELYASHCVSEKHMNNVKAYENFTKLKQWYYEPLREMLSEVLQELKRFESENVASNLRITIQVIEKELVKNEKALTEIQYSAEWKDGASQIEQDMQGRMDALITDAKDKLSKEQTRVQQLQEQAAAATNQEEDKNDENLLDDRDGSQSEEEINRKVDPNEVKERERQRKRERKKLSKHRGSKR